MAGEGFELTPKSVEIIRALIAEHSNKSRNTPNRQVGEVLFPQAPEVYVANATGGIPALSVGSGCTVNVTSIGGGGTITAATIQSGGTGYPASQTLILVVSDETGTSGKLTVTTDGSGVVTAITGIAAPGIGYTVINGLDTSVDPSSPSASPRHADCNVYQLVTQDGGTVVLSPVDGLTRTVYNLSLIAISAGSLVIVTRDKFGSWVTSAASSSGGNSCGGTFVSDVCPKFAMLNIGGTPVQVQVGTYVRYSTIDPETCERVDTWLENSNNCCLSECCYGIQHLCATISKWDFGEYLNFILPLNILLTFDGGDEWKGTGYNDAPPDGLGSGRILIDIQCLGSFYTVNFTTEFWGDLGYAGVAPGIGSLSWIVQKTGCPTIGTGGLTYSTKQLGDCNNFSLQGLFRPFYLPTDPNYDFDLLAMSITNDLTNCTGSGSGSGSGSGAGCCTGFGDVSTSVQATITSVSGCACLTSGSPLTLPQGSDTTYLVNLPTLCSVNTTIALTCDPSTGYVTLVLTDNVGATQISLVSDAPATRSPFICTFTNKSIGMPWCIGNVTINVVGSF